MKIIPNQNTTIDAVSKSPTPIAHAPGAKRRREVPPARTDEVQIGKQSRLLKKAQDAVQNADDVRADRVSEITTKLQSGRYRIDADGIAQRILDKP